MSMTPRQRRTAAARATRQWRRRQAKGIRLVSVEVSEAKLAQLVAERLLPAAATEDSVRLGAVLSQLIEQRGAFLPPVTAHQGWQSQAGQGYEHGDGITATTGSAQAKPLARTQVEHPDFPGRDIRGRWLKGTSGYPPIQAFERI